MDSRDRVYAADTALNIVAVFDLGEKQVESRHSTARAPILAPLGVAVDGNDRLFVSEAKGRIYLVLR